ncbi:HD domain-containing protein [Sinimarinibacterium sp. CAU 1509]|uniref:HD domain-containing protein n=1 Tax=Sinimarinibacterium sp. CAU 1509 TaxID=2562283 RepID=UPI001B7F82B2|nr:HD domain-containing protein [Sinimarinibacterium sp. CAU 1509]
MPVIEFPLLDELLARYAAPLGGDHLAYRNHCQRMANFALALSGDTPEHRRKISIAAAFHDLGIWTHHTFDYLAPSEQLAEGYLDDVDASAWTPEIRAMIREHHKIRRYREKPAALVEAFRQADLVDVSLRLIRFGLPRPFLREVSAAFPNAGFHKRLVQLAWQRLRTHPFSPMPMMRW